MNLNNVINGILDIQAKIISDNISKEAIITPNKLGHTTDDELYYSELNYSLLNNGKKNIYYQVHLGTIVKLLHILFDKYSEHFVDDIAPEMQLQDSKLYEDLNRISTIVATCSETDLVELMEHLHYDFLNSEYTLSKNGLKKNKSKLNLKEKGIVYTPSEITEKIVLESIKEWKKKNANVPKLLDFGCGTGRFYISALKLISNEFECSTEDCVLNNLFGIDSDPIAITILRANICTKVRNFSNKFVACLTQNIICKDMLKIRSNQSIPTEQEIDYSKLFQNVFEERRGFDIIVSNPPYFVLKSTGNKQGLFKNFYELQKKKIESEVDYFRNSGFYTYSIEGMLNYYRLSIECMIKISNSNGVLGIICPATLFGDISAKKLRYEMFNKNTIQRISYYPEKTKLFEGISQATTIFILSKGGSTKDIHLEINNGTAIKFELNFELVRRAFQNLEIPFIPPLGWAVIQKLSMFKKISQSKNIRNRRGELDLTLHKKFITAQNTGYPLVRGKDIQNERICFDEPLFVDIDSFIKIKSKDYAKNDFNRPRLVGQQIVNIDATKRLNFVVSEKNHILGNSCNYLSVVDSTNLNWLVTQLNSYLLNWRFKITSTNNHVNNYELDELPILEDSPSSFRETSDSLTKNVFICKSFNLSLEETKYVLGDHFKSEIINNAYSQVIL